MSTMDDGLARPFLLTLVKLLSPSQLGENREGWASPTPPLLTVYGVTVSVGEFASPPKVVTLIFPV